MKIRKILKSDRMEEESWWVYIVECSDNSYYTGITTNLKKRIKKHNSGKGAKYTNSRKPVKLVYSEELSNRSEATKREIEIKKLSHQEKITLVTNQSS